MKNILNKSYIRTPSLKSVNNAILDYGTVGLVPVGNRLYTTVINNNKLHSKIDSIGSSAIKRRCYSNKVNSGWWVKTSKAIPVPSTLRIQNLRKLATTSLEARIALQLLSVKNKIHKLNYSTSLGDYSKINFSPSSGNINSSVEVDESNITYLRDLILNKGLNWKTTTPNTIRLGDIGDMSYYNYTTKSLLDISDYKDNIQRLQSIFDAFNNVNSYAIAFLVRNGRDNSIITLDKHFLVNNTTNVNLLLQQVYGRIDALSGKYNFIGTDKITVKVRALHFKVNDPTFAGGKIKDTTILPTSNNIKMRYKLLSSNYIPHTMNLQFYGTLLIKKDNILWFEYGNVIIKVEVINENSYHKLEILSKENFKLIAKLEDISFDNTLIRQFLSDKQDIVVQYDLNYKLINLEYSTKVSFMESQDKDLIHERGILTFDMETYVDGAIFVPYACGFYDGKMTHTYYLSDFENSETMILKCLQHMVSPKYHKYTVYCHNFARFDSIFLHQIFHTYFNVSNIISKELDIISVTLTSRTNFGKIKPRLKFSDSICILPSSLEKLGKAFDVETPKGQFPYTFVNADNLNYVGGLPDISYYNSNTMTVEKYNDLKIKTNMWSMRGETLIYLDKDLICLFQVVNKMSDVIFRKYRINITKYTTVSGLAMAIYRSNFLNPEHKLAHSTGSIENAIRSAYFGGRTEVFVPIGDRLVSYDYNGLYPTAMLQPMPVGQPTFSLGKDLNKIFGFVKAKITTTAINIPVLPCRININGEEKLIFPIGSWTGWYFSEELKLAAQYGYIIEVMESYIFEKGYGYFDNYVNEMAFIKDNSSGAMREIHKLLLNTLYGRMGMKNQADCIKILSSSEAEKIHLSHIVIDNFRVGEDKEYIRYHNTPDEGLCAQSGIDFEEALLVNDSKSSINTSSAIAAATASWARILMYPYIIKSLYTDTDSVFLKNPLNENVVGKGLGKFKAEHGTILSAIFPSPKLYFLEREDGTLISKRKGFRGKLSKFEYMELYNGGAIDVMDVRWRRNLELGTLIVTDHKMKLTSNFDKRQKIFSLGKWVSTSPLCVNSSLECVTTALTVYKDEGIDNQSYNLALITYSYNLALITYNNIKCALIIYKDRGMKIQDYNYATKTFLVVYRDVQDKLMLIGISGNKSLTTFSYTNKALTFYRPPYNSLILYSKSNTSLICINTTNLELLQWELIKYYNYDKNGCSTLYYSLLFISRYTLKGSDLRYFVNKLYYIEIIDNIISFSLTQLKDLLLDVKFINKISDKALRDSVIIVYKNLFGFLIDILFLSSYIILNLVNTSKGLASYIHFLYIRKTYLIIVNLHGISLFGYKLMGILRWKNTDYGYIKDWSHPDQNKSFLLNKKKINSIKPSLRWRKNQVKPLK